MSEEKPVIKVLNLYAGIGGNRKLWPENIDVTAVEINPVIAAEYKRLYPKDKVVVGDAHEYLLKNFQEYDFIWSSPPCPTHSDIRRMGVDIGKAVPKYPDMKLYEEIILLKHFFKGKWVVENVKSYYDPLIKPFERARHYFWSNFYIGDFKQIKAQGITNINGTETIFGFNVEHIKGIQKRKLLRNLVNPRLGLHVFDCAYKIKQEVLY